MRKQIFLITSALFGAAACSGDSLNVRNPNDPDVARAYATPALVEGVFQGLGVLVNNTQRASESVNTQGKVMSGENFSSVANFGMASRAAIPRGQISNDLGNDSQVGNVANWNSFSITSRTAANAIRALKSLIAQGKTLGTPVQDARALAFGYFKMGEVLGYLSFAYDSVAIVSPLLDGATVPELSGAKEANKAAIQYLDSALAYANLAVVVAAPGGFTLPVAWINSPATIDQPYFVRLVRSTRARIRAGAARTPAERAALDWAAIIADGVNGINADHKLNVGGSTGWTAQYEITQMPVSNGWSSMPMYYYGMADTSRAYDKWLATARDAREPFLIQTPDKRWPAGADRPTQNAKALNRSVALPMYFRNRPPGDDVPVAGWGGSYYDHGRWGSITANANTGVFTDMSETETKMLAAEGYIRTGNFAAAADLINKTRGLNGLDSIPRTITSATAPYSTASNCVPRVPLGPSFTSTACGSIFEAMKYEKRLEGAFTGYMMWFTDNRGWGDLIEGTVIEWPVPYQEMQARQKGYYNGASRAPKGTYGF